MSWAATTRPMPPRPSSSPIENRSGLGSNADAGVGGETAVGATVRWFHRGRAFSVAAYARSSPETASSSPLTRRAYHRGLDQAGGATVACAQAARVAVRQHIVAQPAGS